MSHEPASIHVVGPDDLHALDNIASPDRPSFGERKCPMCHGHGEWNDEYFVSGRAIVKACPTCEGFGWLVRSGHHARIDIMLVQGIPHWTLIID